MSIYVPVKDSMIQLLSVPRLATYKTACNGDMKAALELYRWNLDTSMAFFESIHYFEVALRNVIDPALQKAALDGSRSWFDDAPQVPRPANSPLTSKSQGKIKQAKNRILGAGHTESHGHIVAELELGFWWTLLSDEYNRSLWQPTLQNVFPLARRERLHSAIDRIRVLRNRIAHHEPLIHHNLVDDYNRLLKTASYIEPHLPWWIDSTSRLPMCLSRKP